MRNTNKDYFTELTRCDTCHKNRPQELAVSYLDDTPEEEITTRRFCSWGCAHAFVYVAALNLGEIEP